MTAPDLKPCPFCGGIAYLRDDASHSTAYFIGCATEDCFGETHWGQNEAEAVTGWNTRTTPLAEALAVPEVAALVYAAKMVMHDLHHGNGLEGLHANRDRLDAALHAIGGDA